ncbi:MAG: calcium-binding protein, partial [Gammaproteobacteria bacterium]|nr:calcium-binding protein [Gammaproteobacteria bacterium]
MSSIANPENEQERTTMEWLQKWVNNIFVEDPQAAPRPWQYLTEADIAELEALTDAAVAISRQANRPGLQEAVGAYYQKLDSCGHEYANLAYKAVTDTDFAGIVANNFVEAVAEKHSLPLDSKQLMTDLMLADFDMRSRKLGGAPLQAQEIKRYHHKVYGDHGVPASGWTATFFNDNLNPQAWLLFGAASHYEAEGTSAFGALIKLSLDMWFEADGQDFLDSVFDKGVGAQTLADITGRIVEAIDLGGIALEAEALVYSSVTAALEIVRGEMSLFWEHGGAGASQWLGQKMADLRDVAGQQSVFEKWMFYELHESMSGFFDKYFGIDFRPEQLVTLQDVSLDEGGMTSLEITLDVPVNAYGQTVFVTVRDPGLVKLSGPGVIPMDEVREGAYFIVIPALQNTHAIEVRSLSDNNDHDDSTIISIDRLVIQDYGITVDQVFGSYELIPAGITIKDAAPPPQYEIIDFDSTDDANSQDSHRKDGDGKDNFIGSYGGDDLLTGSSGQDFMSDANGNNTFYGGPDRDFLSGGGGDNRFYGGGGDDFISGGERDDWLEGDGRNTPEGMDIPDGQGGNDVLMGDVGHDVILGGGGNDHIYGDWWGGVFGEEWMNWSVEHKPAPENPAVDFRVVLKGDVYAGPSGVNGNDVIYCGAGDDVVFANGGDDIIYGESGNNSAEGQAGNDVLIGGDGNDDLWGDDEELDAEKHGKDILYGNAGNDLLAGGAKDDILIGGKGDDRLYGDSSTGDALYVQTGDDSLEGGEGDDKLYGGKGDDILSGDEGADNLTGGDGDDLALGGVGDDKLWGEDGNDWLGGNADNDYLDGGEGNDELYGGEGDDSLYGGDDDSDDYLEGGSGDDKLWGGGGNDRLEGGEGDDELSGGAGDDALAGGNGIDILMGDEGADSLDGGEGDDVMSGGDGDDGLSGGAGNDILQGHGGNDRLQGGAGNDRMEGGEGIDELLGGDGYDELLGGGGEDVLIGGAGADSLWGNDGNDRLEGGAGNDYLEGGQGFNQLDGGAGNDYFIGGDDQDVLSGGADADRMWGFNGDDNLIGGTGDDELYGGGGNDTQHGGDGADLVIGDAGDDFLSGNAGDDRLAGRTGDDILYGGTGDDSLWGEEGADELHGGEGDDIIRGWKGNDFLYGGAGDDILHGEAGSDTYVINRGDGQDTILETFSAGSGNTVLFGSDIAIDDLDVSVYGSEDADLTIRFNPAPQSGLHSASASGSQPEPAVDQLVLQDWQNRETGTFSVDDFRFSDGSSFTGAELLAHHNIVFQEPTEGDDTLTGGGGNNQISGGGGNDQVYGGGGNDTLAGDAGNDSLYGETGGDTLNGGIGDDTLSGGPGDDMLRGEAGNDTYLFNPGDGHDVITETENADGSQTNILTFGDGAGMDDLDLSAYSLDADNLIIQFHSAPDADRITVENWRNPQNDTYRIDNFRFSDGSEYSGYELLVHHNLLSPVPKGTPGDDILTGGSGDDQITGGDGNDEIHGSGGNDTLDGENDDDTLYGEAGNDLLTGGKGNDTLSGGPGDDVLAGGSGNDTYLLNSGDGHTRIIEFFGSAFNNDDVVVFGPGISAADVEVSSAGNDLLLNLRNA